MENGQVAEPVAWRIFDGEGSYDYREEPPPDVNVAWAAKYGRKYEPLCIMPTPSAIEAWAALIANGLLGQASEEDVREVELKIYELLGAGT